MSKSSKGMKKELLLLGEGMIDYNDDSNKTFVIILSNQKNEHPCNFQLQRYS